MSAEVPLRPEVWEELGDLGVPPTATVVKAVQPSLFRLMSTFTRGNRLLAVCGDQVLLLKAGMNYASATRVLAEAARSDVRLSVDLGGKRGVVEMPEGVRVTIWGEDAVARFGGAL